MKDQPTVCPASLPASVRFAVGADRAARPAHAAMTAAVIAWQIADNQGQEMLQRCRLAPTISSRESISHSTPTTSNTAAA